MQSAKSGVGLRYLSKWALLLERLLALICGRTTRGSSTHTTCFRLEPTYLYVLTPVFVFTQRCVHILSKRKMFESDGLYYNAELLLFHSIAFCGSR